MAELKVTAFARPDISVLGDEEGIERKYGPGAVKPEWLADNPNAPRGISIRPEEKIIGGSALIACFAYIAGCVAAIAAKNAPSIWLLGAITGSSIAGAALGIIIALFISKKLKNGITKQLRKGGLLLWVRTSDRNKEKIAQDILRKHGAKQVHIHSIS